MITGPRRKWFASREPEAAWLASNYSNRTGYAWNNIHRLYERIGRELKSREIVVCVSFASIEPPVECISRAAVDRFFETQALPTWLALARLLTEVRTRNIRYVYLTDQPLVDWRYVLLRAVGVRSIVVHCRISVPDPRPASPETGLRGWAKWIWARVPLAAVDRVYAVSDFVRDRLVRKARFPAWRVIRILNGVDLERFRPLGTGRRSPQVNVFCGTRATAHKGIHVLIEAAALLKARCGPAGFRIDYAGNGPDLQAFRAKVEALDLREEFRFLGEVPSAADYVAAADVVVVPSTWGDACPSAVSEALAAGKPLVATRVGGVPELVGDSGAAILVAPGDPGALADALEELIKDPGRRERLGRWARSRAETVLDERRYHDTTVAQIVRDFRL